MDNNVIVFDTDDGEIELRVIEQTMLAGKNYLLVTDEDEFLILKEMETDDEMMSYGLVEDERELESLVSIFNELVEDLDLDLEV